MSERRIWAIACLVAGLAQAGSAQDLKQVEFTPLFGYTLSGGLEDEDTGEDFEIDDGDCFGGIVDIRVSEMAQIEFFFSRQETSLEFDEGLFSGQEIFDLDVDYYHLGGTYIILDGDWQPFVVGTLGVTRLDPDASGADSDTRFSIGLGGGVRYFPTEHFGLYLGARGFFTFIGGDTIFRSEAGATTIVVDSNGLWQAQLQAGAIFAF